jgi:obg-like ATPase 1
MLQMELCKKDIDYVGRAEQDAVKDVKKTPNMKLPLHFYSTFEKVSQLPLHFFFP